MRSSGQPNQRFIQLFRISTAIFVATFITASSIILLVLQEGAEDNCHRRKLLMQTFYNIYIPVMSVICIIGISATTGYLLYLLSKQRRLSCHDLHSSSFKQERAVLIGTLLCFIVEFSVSLVISRFAVMTRVNTFLGQNLFLGLMGALDLFSISLIMFMHHVNFKVKPQVENEEENSLLNRMSKPINRSERPPSSNRPVSGLSQGEDQFIQVYLMR